MFVNELRIWQTVQSQNDEAQITHWEASGTINEKEGAQ